MPGTTGKVMVSAASANSTRVETDADEEAGGVGVEADEEPELDDLIDTTEEEDRVVVEAEQELSE
jgi:hypothetical protein